MSRELYFLRSSEQKIVVDMFKYAHPDKSEEVAKYTEFYGLTRKDLGIYTLVENEIAGALWSRKFEGESAPTLSLAVVPKFIKEDVASFMMEQFIQEAATLYDELKVEISAHRDMLEFYKKFGFERTDNESILIKRLKQQEIVRPSDGYDASKWMD
jgi:GNAT superfamily N-acetyltransferase